MHRKTRAHKTPSTPSESPSRSEVFRNDKSRETFENLNSKRNVETSPPSSTGADATETSGATAVDADVPPSTTSDDSDIRRTLDHVLTVHAAHGQILVDVLNEIYALHAELAQFRQSSLPPPF